jgi:hypothetical protein
VIKRTEDALTTQVANNFCTNQQPTHVALAITGSTSRSSASIRTILNSEPARARGTSSSRQAAGGIKVKLTLTWFVVMEAFIQGMALSLWSSTTSGLQPWQSTKAPKATDHSAVRFFGTFSVGGSLRNARYETKRSECSRTAVMKRNGCYACQYRGSRYRGM